MGCTARVTPNNTICTSTTRRRLCLRASRMDRINQAVHLQGRRRAGRNGRVGGRPCSFTAVANANAKDLTGHDDIKTILLPSLAGNTKGIIRKHRSTFGCCWLLTCIRHTHTLPLPSRSGAEVGPKVPVQVYPAEKSHRSDEKESECYKYSSISMVVSRLHTLHALRLSDPKALRRRRGLRFLYRFHILSAPFPFAPCPYSL